MGKRKSSPWLATTPIWMLSLLIMTNEFIYIHSICDFFRCLTVYYDHLQRDKVVL
ncbi:hypothetical protein [Thermaerobacillus caldiproteolyticus]|uniref:Uncharacterized protein n=1 Tax=Thermaerobacillus caldiproteolyticus TaxID=247480 RepID=A0A7W0BY04_9BACL|nr:hypothetical protein [Anoxybacillus caldiproteolyticus]MBA2874105.1 hypothetical protein [Anoxybacillus caldiproteolyticus]QPA33363.1 hypothetical protein ISX45_02780 [Anoxybacillus caldiproteolyticus]